MRQSTELPRGAAQLIEYPDPRRAGASTARVAAPISRRGAEAPPDDGWAAPERYDDDLDIAPKAASQWRVIAAISFGALVLAAGAFVIGARFAGPPSDARASEPPASLAAEPALAGKSASASLETFGRLPISAAPERPAAATPPSAAGEPLASPAPVGASTEPAATQRPPAVVTPAEPSAAPPSAPPLVSQAIEPAQRPDPTVASKPEAQIRTESPTAAEEPALRAAHDGAPAVSSDEAARLVARAKTLMSSGQVSGARRTLERALRSGDPQAAFMLAQTYDAQELKALKVLGVAPDAERARALYEQAARGGLSEAKAKLAKMK